MLDEVKIMQFADGTLEPSEREAVQKEIEKNPEYKKMLEDYIYTGELLSNLSKEIKSKPLPTYLSNKIFEFNKNKIELLNKKQSNFNFFNIFKIKYSAVAAGFALFFVGGYTTSHYLIAEKEQTIAMREVKNIENSQPIFRGAKKNTELNLDQSENFYQIFNIEKFNKEINTQIKKAKINQKIKIKFSDKDILGLTVGSNFMNKKKQNCKNLNFEKQVKITATNEPKNASISICNENNQWKFVSLNLD